MATTYVVNGRSVRIKFRSVLARLLTTHDAITFFRCIHVRDASAPADLVAHEWLHTEQERRLWYVGYLPTYFWLLLWHGYDLHPMEVEARRFAFEHWQEFVPLPPAT